MTGIILDIGYDRLDHWLIPAIGHTVYDSRFGPFIFIIIMSDFFLRGILRIWNTSLPMMYHGKFHWLIWLYPITDKCTNQRYQVMRLISVKKLKNIQGEKKKKKFQFFQIFHIIRSDRSDIYPSTVNFLLAIHPIPTVSFA